MASFVNAADAVAAAVEIEKKGHAFYKQVSDKATNPGDKEFFDFMAGEELKHEAIFESMLSRLGGVALPSGSDDDEYLLYVQALIDSHSLFMVNQEAQALLSPLGQAMQLEKDTLLFFIALEEMVPESERKYVRACAEEERKHLKLLAKRMHEVK